MARPRMPARLVLRDRSDGTREWVIRDRQIYRRTGLPESRDADATKMLRAYTQKLYGADAAAKICPPVGVAPKRAVDALMVYFIGDGAAVKIGIARDLRSRFAAIQAHCPQELSIYGTVTGGLSVERALHKRFAGYHIRREWFRMEGDVLDYLRTLPDLAKMNGIATISEPRHSSSKLTQSQVRLIQQNPAGISGREFSRMFGIAEATISQAKSGVWWKHVSEDAA